MAARGARRNSGDESARMCYGDDAE
jgi:hypothetical protein